MGTSWRLWAGRRETKCWNNKVKQNLQAISPRAEFAIVMVLAFGYFMLASILAVFTPGSDATITEASLQFLLVYELVMLVALGAFLSARGWSLLQLGFKPSIKDTAIGIGLAFIAYVAYGAVWGVFGSSIPGLEDEANGLVAPGLGMITILAVSILNPIFEEVFVCGYIITVLKKTRSVSFAINTSVAIRLAYHLYQGAVGVISIIPLGLVFAYWFARTGRLWPVVIAHAIFDLVGLVAYVQL